MSNISLLVDCKKIIQWLQDRKKLSKDWYNYVKAAQQKTKLLIKEKDQFAKYPELVDMIQQNHQNFCYFDVVRFVELLLKTELAKEKSMLFGYSDKRVKEWTNLQKFMAAKNVGLLSNAKFIEQTLKFDLVGLDKNVEMMDGQLGNLRRKIDFNLNTIFQQQKEMKKEINVVGLQIDQGQDLKRFNIQNLIPEIISKVPSTMHQIQQLIISQQVTHAVSTYKHRLAKDGLPCDLPLLQYFFQHQNDYLDVYRGLIAKDSYANEDKYRQFKNWRSVNEWEIVVENVDNFGIEELKLNLVTLIEDKESRQKLVYELNEVMYYFVGLKVENGGSGKKLESGHIGMTDNEIEKTIVKLQNIISLLTSKRLLTPLQLKTSKKSYQYFVSKFHNFQKNIDTLETQIQDYRRQIEQLEGERNQQVQKLRKLRSKVVQVKKAEEKLLTELIGKEVKIVGDVNKLE